MVCLMVMAFVRKYALMARLRVLLSMLSLLLLFQHAAHARVLYVDNQNGSDGNDGLSETAVTMVTGPFRTIRQALFRAQRGDEIFLRPTSEPYAEMITLSRANHTGYPTQPLVIDGRGATLSGTEVLPTDGWRKRTDGLWRISLTRKGYYSFFRNGQALAEYRPEPGVDPLTALPADQWLSRQGEVLFRFAPDASPLSDSWAYGAREFGVSMVNVRHVVVRNLTIEGFRVDGVNVDGNCDDVLLQNVTIRHQGRAGLAVGGASHVLVRDSQMRNNGREAVLVTERGGLQMERVELDGAEPTVIP